MAKVIAIHAQKEGRPAEMGATWWTKAKTVAMIHLGRFLHRLGVPGCVRDVELDDLVTGDHVEIRNSPLSVTITLNNRDYCFDRFTGRFVGTGHQVRSDTCRPNRFYRYNPGSTRG